MHPFVLEFLEALLVVLCVLQVICMVTDTSVGVLYGTFEITHYGIVQLFPGAIHADAGYAPV